MMAISVSMGPRPPGAPGQLHRLNLRPWYLLSSALLVLLTIFFYEESEKYVRSV